ncbi:MAG: N-6 DNA methylase [Bacteroidales bacterium]|jgi:type I restriction-modification system DNA methylase subunit|nr:N-6 DNA methylase [Bacteroidales bacterium]
MNLIETGIALGLIKLDDDKSSITYVHQNKRRNFNNPEEKVQMETFLTLVLLYGYPVNRIKQYVSVQMGSETKEADLIVYSDDNCEETFILIECKKEDVNEQQFNIAVDQAYSYAVAEGAKYVWTTSKLKNQYYEIPDKKPKSRVEIPDIPQFGQAELAPYKYVKGGLSQIDTEGNISEPKPGYGREQKFFELQVVSENELTRIFIQAHQALWGGGQRNPSVAFDELDKLIFCKIWDEKWRLNDHNQFQPRKTGEPYDFQIFKDEDPEDLLKRIRKIYAVGEKEAPEVFKDGISLTAQETMTIVKYFQRINLNKTDLDSKGKAFETFMGSYFRGDFGQYFTPRTIVKFIVDCLPITQKSRVLDTSCGSGGFLLFALDKIRQQANEFFNPIKEEKDHYTYWHDFAEKNLYGIEINDQIARTAKMNMIIHDDGHTNVIASDGLLSDKDLQERSKNFEFRYNSFDFIITNPPFGSSVKQTEKAYMHQYSLALKEPDWLGMSGNGKLTVRESQSTEVLFIEQCHRFLREHGYLAIVIPDGILTNSSLQYVRDRIEEMYRIVAVVSMPQTAFTATGAGVKSSVLFLRKHAKKQTERIVALKEKLKERIKSDTKFAETLSVWEKKKDAAIKQIEKSYKDKNPGASRKEILAAVQVEKQSIQNEFSGKVDSLKEELTEKYFAARQKELDDYPIFMAIAEDIGYDATGRSTGHNELIEIGRELTRFIQNINKTEI